MDSLRCPTLRAASLARGRRNQPFISREPEIIVATKIDEFATIEFNAHRLRTLAHGKLTAQPSAIQSLELFVDPR